MPHAFKLEKEHGKQGLTVILLESQMESDKKADVLGFALQRFPKDFPTSSAFVTVRETPFNNGLDGLPQCALIGPDGKLVLMGHNGSLGSKLEDAIAEELKKVQTGWGKSSEAKKARSLMYGKKKLAEAAAALAAAEGKVKDDAKDDLAEAKAELDAKYASQKGAITVLLEAGRYGDAKTAATELQKAVKGKSDWEAEVNTIVADFAKPDVDKELKLDKSLVGIIKSFGDKKPTEDHEKKFKDFAKKNESTKVGARAAMLAEAVAWKDPAAGSKKDKEEKAAKDAKDAKEEKKDDPKKKDEGTGSKGE